MTVIIANDYVRKKTGGDVMKIIISVAVAAGIICISSMVKSVCLSYLRRLSKRKIKNSIR